MNLKSYAFNDGGMIPEKYSANSENLSPPLVWKDVPKGAKSLALFCEDSDAPGGNFTHWAIYNIPPNWRELPESIGKSQITRKVHQGINDAGKLGYFGPKPPANEMHHYHFRLIALSDKTDLIQGLSEQELKTNMKGKIIDECELTGMYRGHELKPSGRDLVRLVSLFMQCKLQRLMIRQLVYLIVESDIYWLCQRL